jgi:hypothetical protein
MSFDTQKITDDEIAAVGVVSQPNKLTGTAQQNKSVFDALVKLLVKVKFNALIDELMGGNAAGQLGVDTIPGLDATTVQAALEEIMENIQGITQGAVADGSIDEDKLADLAVTEDKLASGAVTEAKLGDGAVTENKLGANAVSTGKIALLAVTTALLAAGAVTTEKIAALAVTREKIDNAAVDNTKLALDAVTKNKIKDGEVAESKLAADAVTTDKIKDGAVTYGKMAANSVGSSQLRDGSVSFAKLLGSQIKTFNISSGGGIVFSVAANSRAVALVSSASVYGIAFIGRTSNGNATIHLEADNNLGYSSTAGTVSIHADVSAGASGILFVLSGTVTPQ